MDIILNKFWDFKASCCIEVNAEVCEREKLMGQIERAIDNQPSSFTVLDSILSQEVDRRSTTTQTSTTTLQVAFQQGFFY